jgi:hypothetical protein
MLVTLLGAAATFAVLTSTGEAGGRSDLGLSRVQRPPARALSTALAPGKELLLELNALSGKSKLPRKYRKLGKVPSGVVLSKLSSTYQTLSVADQRALAPFFLQPRYRQSAWGSLGRASSRPAARTSDSTDPCAALETVAGGWAGIETPHAWFWYRSGRSAAKAHAGGLAAEFTAKIWPTLTGAFKTVDDTAGSACDPAGDNRIDIYLTPANAVLSTAGGVAPGIPIGQDLCGPLPSFVIIPENATRWTLAHEFMHVIQWGYRACERAPAWVEGTATWAGDYVYKNDQNEHRWKTALTSPFVSMLAGDLESGYNAWPFWYSLTKKDNVGAVKRVFDALATQSFAGALEAGPSDGLREAWKRYAIEQWNASPIGSAGFPVQKSLKSWDSFGAKPGGVPTENVAIGAAKTKTFELDTSTQPPLSTWFNEVKINDRKVRHIKFENADFGKPGSMVQAFFKLANGKWRLEDWSNKSSAAFCRDKADQNVVELVIVSSNASARGAPLGAVKHKLVAKNRCGLPERFTGTWTSVYTNPSRGSWQVTINGTATFVRSTPAAIDSGPIEYALTDTTVTWTASGSQDLGGGCSYTFSGGGSDTSPAPAPNTELSLEDVSNRPEAPKPEPTPFYYSIHVAADESRRHEYDITTRCPDASETRKDSVPGWYLYVGFRDWSFGIPPEIMKTAEPTLLEGHRSRTYKDSSLVVDDTWRFEGSD